MQTWRPTRWRNPGAWYTVLGLLVLLGSMYVPWLAAARTARTERRADELAELLLQVAEEPIEPLTQTALDTVRARFLRAAACAGVYTADLEVVEPTPAGALLLLHNKHYGFQLAESPLGANLVPGRDTTSAYEVVAWPLDDLGPGHSAYFHPADGPRAYTRNLGSGFAGLGEQRPAPGVCQLPRGATTNRYYYRGTDDKRWILY